MSDSAGFFLVAMLAAAHTTDRLHVPPTVKKLLLLTPCLLFGLLIITGADKTASSLWTILLDGFFKGTLQSPAGLIAVTRQIQIVAETEFRQVTLLLSVLYLLLQTLCVPGTIVLNVIIGSLFGVGIGLPLCVLLGTLGASCCYLVSLLVGVKLIEAVDARLMKSKGLPKLRHQVAKFRADLFVYLLFLRLTPILPNWLINLASPMVHVPLSVFTFATFVGIMPQTYLAVRFGSLAHHHTTNSSDNPQRTTDEGVVTKWDTLLLAIVACAIVTIAKLRKKFFVVDS